MRTQITRIIEIDHVDSTNSFAERLLSKQKVQDGTIIRAHEQSAGRGQGKKTWLSEPGKNLTFSIILYPAFLPPGQQFMLNKAITLGILDFLESFTGHPLCRIKWPNDILFNHGKLGGILINNMITGSEFYASVVGIGLNINQTRFDPSLPDPVSLKLIISRDTELREALLMLIDHLDQRYNKLKNRKFDELNDGFRKNLIGYDEVRQFRIVDEIVTGKITGVDSFGRLLLEFPDGQQKAYSHGEIEYLF